MTSLETLEKLTLDLELLERLAHQATAGPWKVDTSRPEFATDAITLKPGYWFSPGHYPKCYTDEDPAMYDKDAAYIAAANPSTILALCAEMKRLRRALEQCKVEYWKRCSTGSGRITSLTVSEFDAFIDAALKGET